MTNGGFGTVGAAGRRRGSKERLAAWLAALLVATAPGVLAQRATEARRANQPAGVPSKEALRVVLVLDVSGSMKANDPQGLVKAAATKFVEGLSDRDEAGLVVFETDARLVAPLRKLGTPGAREALVSALAATQQTGRRTDIPKAVERALYELKQATSPAREAMVLVTDGIVDVGSPEANRARLKWLADDLLPDSRASGVRIIGIAFTEQADYTLLQSMAHATSGAYFRALTHDDVGRIFTDARTALEAPTREEIAAVEQAARDKATAEAAARAKREAPVQAAAPAPVPVKLIVLLLAIMALGLGVLIVLALRRPRPHARAVPVSPHLSELVDDDESQHGILQDVFTGERHRITKHLTTLGRRSDNDIVVDDRTISAQHAQIVRRSGHFYVVDLRSTNGTWLNDRRVGAETLLRTGDVLRLDRHAFRYEGELPAGTESWPEGEGTVLRMAGPDAAEKSTGERGAAAPPWPGEGPQRKPKDDRPDAG